MAKPRKKKSGLHKGVSSVLKGVPIPQGVHNWRPPEISDADRTDDSASYEPSHVSSVFKGAAAEPERRVGPPAEPLPENRDAKVPAAKKSDDRRASRSTLIRKLDCPEDFSIKAEQVRKSGPAARVVHYHDPIAEKTGPSVEKQLQDKSRNSKRVLGKKGRKALVLSAPVLIIIIILIYKYCFRAAPQQTEASVNVNGTPPSISTSDAKVDVDWQVPEPLPARMMDLMTDPEEKAGQNEQPKEPAKGKTAIDLRAILFSANRPSAVIGGRIMHVGDKLGDVTITNITEDSVEFGKDGKTWVQKLRK